MGGNGSHWSVVLLVHAWDGLRCREGLGLSRWWQRCLGTALFGQNDGRDIGGSRLGQCRGRVVTVVWSSFCCLGLFPAS
jgi:hypothetical protein